MSTRSIQAGGPIHSGVQRRQSVAARDEIPGARRRHRSPRSRERAPRDRPDPAGAGAPARRLPYLERAAAALARIRVEDQAVGELAAQALLTRAHCLQELGQFDEGLAHARGALRVARRVDADAALVASIHNQLGMRGKFSGGAGPGLIRGRRRSELGLQGAGPG